MLGLMDTFTPLMLTALNWVVYATWLDVGATALVLLLAALLLGSMFLFIKVMTADSDEHKGLRELVETLFGTPAHLRSQSGEAASDAASMEDLTAAISPYTEPCPACSETITEQHTACPSCELRLR